MCLQQKNCTFLQELFIIISEAEQKQIEYIRSSSLAQKSPNLTGDPLELLEADEVLDPVNGGGLQDLVPGELADSLGGLLALLLGLADADEFVALAQEGRHALASVVGRHVERFSALQERKHIVGTLYLDLSSFFSKGGTSGKGFKKWQTISHLRQISRDVCVTHLYIHQEKKNGITHKKGGRGGGRFV